MDGHRPCSLGLTLRLRIPCFAAARSAYRIGSRYQLELARSVSEFRAVFSADLVFIHGQKKL